MILIIDNYDSFTYNLVQAFGEMGAEPIAARNDEITLGDIANLRPQGIVISPGPGTPERAGISLETIQHFAGKIPILGVCLGHQAIGQAFGGRVVRAPYLMHGKTSEISHDGKTIFQGIPSPFTATRYHSLIVDLDTLPPDLEVSADTDDQIVMGLRHRKFFCEGVQFHPESILTFAGKKLMANFLAMTNQR